MNDPLGLFENDPLGLFEEQPSVGKKVKTAFLQQAASIGNTADTTLTLVGSLPVRIFGGQASQEDMFKNLDARRNIRNQWADKIDPGFWPKAAATVATLPAGMISSVASFPETGRQFLESGESLGKALTATGIDAAGNVIGFALPAGLGKGLVSNALSGAGINAAQDALSKLFISGIADKKETKQMFSPTTESALLAGIIGGGFGAATSKKGSDTFKQIQDKLKELTKQTTPVEKTKTTDLGQQLAEARYRDDLTVARLEAALAKQNPEQPTIVVNKQGDAFTPDNMLVENKIKELDFNKTKQEAADALIADRQRALEEQVARQTQLDRQAAERARQEAAPTGYDNWVEQQRMAAEQRIPGNNDPLNLFNEKAPYSLTDSPYHDPNGLDYSQHMADILSQGVEKASEIKQAWEQRAKEQSAENIAAAQAENKQNARELSLQPLEEQLRANAYKPTGNGQGPKTRNFLTSRQGGNQGGSAPILSDIANIIVHLARSFSQFLNKHNKDLPTKEQRLGMSTVNNDLKQHIAPGPDVSSWIEAAKQDNQNGPVWQNWQSGLGQTSIKVNSAGMLGAYRWLQFGQKGGEYFTRKMVYPVEQMLKKLSKQDLIALEQTLVYEQLNRTGFDDSQLTQAGLSTKVIEAKKALKTIKDDILKRTNNQLVSMGKNPMTSEEFHFASKWQGDWGAPVYTKDGKLVWWVRAPSRSEVSKALKYLAKEHPELDINVKSPGILNKFSKFDVGQYADGKRIGSTDIRNASNPFSDRVPRDVLGTYRAMMEMFGDNEVSKAIQESLTNYMKESGFNYTGFKKHFEEKANIRGFRGDQPWLSDKENAYQGMRSQIEFTKQAYAWLAQQESLQKVGEFLKDPELNASQPENMALVKAYVNQAAGVSNNIMQPIEQHIAKILGRSRMDLYNTTGVLKGATYLLQLGFSPAHFIATIGNAAIAVPYTAKILANEGYKLSGVKAIKAYTTGLADATAGILAHSGNYITGGKVNPQQGITKFGQAALKFADDNGIISKNIYDEAADLGSHPVLDFTKAAADFSISTPEHIARSIAYMTFAHHLKESAAGKTLTDMQIFQKAGEFADNALTGYAKADRPLIVDKFGAMGNMAYTYKAYLFNLANTINTMARHKDVVALGILLGGLGYMGGVGNMPFVSEMDGANQIFRDWLAEDHPDSFAKLKEFMPYGIKGEILKSDLPTWLKWGAASAATGAGIQSKFSPQFIDVEKPFDNLIGPAAVEAREWAGAAQALQHPNKDAISSAIYQNVPPAIQGVMENLNDTFGRTNPDGSRTVYNPKDWASTENKYTRTPKEQMYRYAGTKALTEVDSRTKKYLVDRENQRISQAADTSLKRMGKAIINNDAEQVEKFANLYYSKFEGDNQRFNSFISKLIEQNKMTPEQFAQAHAKGLHAVMNVKRRMEIENGSK